MELVVTMNKISEMLVMIVVEETSSIDHLEYKHLMNNSLDPYKHVVPSEWDEILKIKP